MRKHPVLLPLLVILLLFSLSGCSVNRLIVDIAIDALGSGGSGGGNAFTSDEDPELIADALPLGLKLMESMLDSSPDNTELLYTVGMGFVMYANAFIQQPADLLGDEKWQEQKAEYARAKKMYLRGRRYLLQGLDILYPGFSAAMAEGRFEDALAGVKAEHAPYLYWTAAGWLGAVAIDILDAELMVTLNQGFSLVARSLELDPSQASVHELMMTINSSMPVDLLYRQDLPAGQTDMIRDFVESYYAAAGAGSDPRARAAHHFDFVKEATGDMSPGIYLGWASGFLIADQDAALFREYMEKVLSYDPDADPDNRLVTILTQRKARWYLDNMENFFLEW